MLVLVFRNVNFPEEIVHFQNADRSIALQPHQSIPLSHDLVRQNYFESRVCMSMHAIKSSCPNIEKGVTYLRADVLGVRLLNFHDQTILVFADSSQTAAWLYIVSGHPLTPTARPDLTNHPWNHSDTQ